MVIDTPTTVPLTNNTLDGTSNGTSNRNNTPGRGGRGHRGGGRFIGRGGRSDSNGPNTRTPTVPIFKGNTKEMNGHVFQVHNECVDPRQFDKTMEALNEYAMKTYDLPGDLLTFFKDLSVPTIPRVPNLPKEITDSTGAIVQSGPDDFDLRVWKNAVDDYCKRSAKIHQNLVSLYAVAWGQCSEAMKAKLQSHDLFIEKDQVADCSWLLKEIKAITFRFEGQRLIFLSLDDAHSDFRATQQGTNESLTDYLHNFKSKIDVLEHYGGSYGIDEGLIQASQKIPGAPSDKVALMKYTRGRALAIAFLKRADPTRYGTLWADLENQFSRGTDQYPMDLTGAYNLLLTYKRPPTQTKPPPQRVSPNVPAVSVTNQAPNAELGMTFAQTAATVAGTDGALHRRITCFKCDQAGHYANVCPNNTTEHDKAVQLVQQVPQARDHVIGSPNPLGFSFTQPTVATIPRSWVLLDSESTVSVFNNPALLKNIRRSATTVTVLTNGGAQVSSFVGDIPNFGQVWYNPSSIANILSLASVRKVCRITMDTAVDASFTVHKKDGSCMVFCEYHSGLYYHDTSLPVSAVTTQSNASTSATVINYTLINSVAHNKTMFTRREIEGADSARELYKKIGRPSERFFQHILSQQMIHNCPVTADDAKRALIIYGPDLATLKGKTTKKSTQHVPSTVTPNLPPYILEHHGKVTLCLDIFFVQGQRFHHTISRDIKFRTVAHITTANKTTLQEQTRAVIQAYNNRGFTVANIHADGAFECIREAVTPAILNINATDDHVGEVERSIRTIKERVRAAVHDLPFRRLPREMIKGAVRFAVKSLNQFPAEDGISDILSPTTIVTGLPPPNYNHLQLEFGEYVTIFEENNPTNTNASRVVDAIALHQTGNVQGDYYFMSLSTGERVSRRQYTRLPITQRVIDAVEALAFSQGQPILPGSGPIFTWNLDDDPIVDDDYEGVEPEVAEDEEDDITIVADLPHTRNPTNPTVAVIAMNDDTIVNMEQEVHENEGGEAEIPDFLPPRAAEDIVPDNPTGYDNSGTEEEIVFGEQPSTTENEEPVVFSLGKTRVTATTI